MAGDYEKYRKTRNLTFIGINTSRTSNQKTVAAQVEQYKLKPFANMIDAGGATAMAYSVPKNAPNWLVVIDGDGKIAYNASKGWRFTGGENTGKFCHQVAIDESIARSKGILGIDNLPEHLFTAAHFFDLQQFMLIEPELKRVQSAHQKDPDIKNLISAFHDRIAASRHARVERIKDLCDTNPLQGYREAVAFVQAFGDAPERTEVNDLGKKALKDKSVQRELQAEEDFNKILVPIMSRTSTLTLFDSNLKPALASFLKAYHDTKYAQVAEIAVTAHGDAIRNPNN